MIQQVGKYVLESELGKGAMGSVWLSRHPGLDIPVAVKILDPGLAAEDPDYMHRFVKEGKIAASINHQNIVRIIDAGQDGSVFYLVMELIDGADAKQLVEHRGALPVGEVLELAICTAEALSEAHKAGIVHRDIKPDNILITADGKVKLADLGIAKQLNDDYGTTMAGTTIGTPYYIAPEQAMDSSTVDTRCDLYALGGTLYHLLTGSVPFTGPSAMAILMKHTQEELQHPKERRPDLPINLCNVVLKMLKKHQDDRYKTGEELLKDLYAVRAGKGATSTKKKKHFKAPSNKKENMSKIDKEVAGVKPAAKSAKKSSTKKKKGSKTPIIIALVTISIIIASFLIFRPDFNSAQAKNQDQEEKPKKDISESVTTSVKNDVDKIDTANKSGPIKIINQPFPYTLDSTRSKKLGWKKSWTIFAEFKGSEGNIFSKGSPNKWNDKSKALFVGPRGYLIYMVGKTFFSSSKQVNDGREHRVILQSQGGSVTMYLDGQNIGVKKIWAEDYSNFQVNVGTRGTPNSQNYKGQITRVAFWDEPYPSSKLNDLFKGSFNIDRTTFYYESQFKSIHTNTSKPVKSPKGVISQIIDDLKRDNPGIKIGEKRVHKVNGGIRVNLSKTKVRNITSLKKYPITELDLSDNKIDDLSALRELPLVNLDLSFQKSPVSLKHLNPKSLKFLRLMMTNLKDLNEFKKFNLQYLAVKQHPFLTGYIKHMHLYRLDMDSAEEPIKFDNLNKQYLKEMRVYFGKGVKNISSLKGFNLKAFHLTDSPCHDLSVLKGMPLEDVAIIGTKVKDISFMENAPVKHLILNFNCENVGVIKTLKNLQTLAIPGKLWGPEIEYLRNRNVNIEGFTDKKKHWWLSFGMIAKADSKQFWKDYDEHRKSSK